QLSLGKGLHPTRFGILTWHLTTIDRIRDDATLGDAPAKEAGEACSKPANTRLGIFARPAVEYSFHVPVGNRANGASCKCSGQSLHHCRVSMCCSCRDSLCAFLQPRRKERTHRLLSSRQIDSTG